MVPEEKWSPWVKYGPFVSPSAFSSMHVFQCEQARKKVLIVISIMLTTLFRQRVHRELLNEQ